MKELIAKLLGGAGATVRPLFGAFSGALSGLLSGFVGRALLLALAVSLVALAAFWVALSKSKAETAVAVAALASLKQELAEAAASSSGRALQVYGESETELRERNDASSEVVSGVGGYLDDLGVRAARGLQRTDCPSVPANAAGAEPALRRELQERRKLAEETSSALSDCRIDLADARQRVNRAEQMRRDWNKLSADAK